MTRPRSTADSLAIQAIPTTYRGVTYRSRLEARWAVLFHALGLRYEYELQGYNTTAGYYLPDFWLPEWRMFAEVKPVPFTGEQKAKCAAVSHGTTFPFLLLPGSPENVWYECIQPAGYPEWLDLWASVDKARPFYAYAGTEYPTFPPMDHHKLSGAMLMARSARFAA